MACLLALILAATVLTVPTGNKLLTSATRTTSPAEAFWRTALPGAPIPEAIRELLHPRAGAAVLLNDDVKLKDDGDDPPPMNFNYDDYNSAAAHRRQNENAAPKLDASAQQNAPTHGNAAAAAAATSPTTTAFFLEEDAAAMVEAGSSFMLCRRVAGGRGDGDAAVVVCHRDDTSRWDPGHVAFRLLNGKLGSVGYTIPGAQVFTTGNEDSPVTP